MSRIFAIFKREVTAYFLSPIGFVIFAIFMLISGIYLAFSLQNSYSDIASEIGFLQIILVVIIPVLTMRAFSEDRKNGTEVLLFTSPASTLEIVLAKYLASFALFLMLTATTLIHVMITIAYGGLIDISVLGAYTGFIFLGAAYIGIGVFASALTENQIIAAIISLVTIFILSLIESVSSVIGTGLATLLSLLNFFGLLTDIQINDVGTAVSEGINWLSPNARLTNYVNGIFELSPLVYFISLTVVFLFLTNRIIEKRRWSQR